MYISATLWVSFLQGFPTKALNEFPFPRRSEEIQNRIFFYGEGLLALRPNPQLEDLPLSAVHDCLFNIDAATLHLWRPFPRSTTLECDMDPHIIQ